jgi:hypothetical protein
MTPAEMVALARQIANFEIAPDLSPAFQALGAQDRRHVLGLACYEIERRLERPPQRKATRLLASWLTQAQRRQFGRRGYVHVRGSAGGRYRIHPYGGADKIERHGKRWFARADYCLHDEARELPQADVALAHYLWIVTDEPTFLRMANEHKREMLWNGAWLRRLNAARRQRERDAAA